MAGNPRAISIEDSPYSPSLVTPPTTPGSDTSTHSSTLERSPARSPSIDDQVDHLAAESDDEDLLLDGLLTRLDTIGKDMDLPLARLGAKISRLPMEVWE
jgi:hypothetical protein